VLLDISKETVKINHLVFLLLPGMHFGSNNEMTGYQHQGKKQTLN